MKKILLNSILDLGKCPNRKMCTFTFMRLIFFEAFHPIFNKGEGPASRPHLTLL